MTSNETLLVSVNKMLTELLEVQNQLTCSVHIELLLALLAAQAELKAKIKPNGYSVVVKHIKDVCAQYLRVSRRELDNELGYALIDRFIDASNVDKEVRAENLVPDHLVRRLFEMFINNQIR